VRDGPQRRRLADGRLHLQHGPIDLIIEAFGPEAGVSRAYAAAWSRFEPLLDELCDELAILRQAAGPGGTRPQGNVARRMFDAVLPFGATGFITPMAAVAGSVAEEILAAMVAAAELDRAYVNNGGDIALHLAPGRSFKIGLIDRPDRPSLFGRAEIRAEDAIGGIATSGWRGRSFSLGIADTVTILAATAAMADAAATWVANAVDLPRHPSIKRQKASDFDPQSDLGERLVTVEVGTLVAEEIDSALAAGCETAELLRRDGYIVAAALHLEGETRIVSGPGRAPK
jgi:ApbE superfamily uncharacterized protein (UPF0280 family)